MHQPITDMLVWGPAAVLGVSAGVWAWLLLTSGWRKNEQYRLEAEDASPEGRDADAVPVVVICPGRNEAEHLPSTLDALCRQDYGNYRVIFVDDQSNDDTPAVVERLGERHAHLIGLRNDEDPPAGWIGKCYAIHLAVTHLRRLEAESPGEPRARFLCFTDADIHWDPLCLRANVEHARRHGAGLVALFPKLVFGLGAGAVGGVHDGARVVVVVPVREGDAPPES